MEKEVEEKIGYTFKDKELIRLAFTHRSYWNEHKETTSDHNERLEFLGDSVLGLLVAEHLYHTLPHMDEGVLSKLRSGVVAAEACADYSKKLGVDSYILLGKGEQLNARGRESIHADLFEALIGAIYVDGGAAAAKKFLFTHFLGEIQERVVSPSRNWKAELQDYAQKKYQETPTYEVLEEFGPAHQKEFRVAVVIQSKKAGVGIGASKKEAQTAAAKAALEEIEKW